MICIYCNADTRVVNSRHQKRLNRIWRRRTCMTCGTTFTSIEAIDIGGSVTVRSSKSLQPFQRDKLLLSVYNSLKHRKTALNDATGLTDTVISQLYPLMHDATVENTDIITITIQILERFDKTAVSHYAAFHPTK